MYRKNLFIVLAMLLVLMNFVGCGGSSEESLEEYASGNVHETTSTVVDGKLTPANTPDGSGLVAQDDSFAANAVVNVVEKDFDSKSASKFLTNGAKSYEIFGYLKSANSFSSDIPITVVDKPVTVRMNVSSFPQEKVEDWFVGKRSRKGGDWNFLSVDKFGNVSNSARAAIVGSVITFDTTDLDIEVAPFAKIAGSDKVVPATVVNSITVGVTGASDNSGNTNIRKIKVNNQKYDEDMKVVVKVDGKNVNNLKNSDFIANITYLNDNPTTPNNIAPNAVCETPTKSNSNGDKFVHNIIVRGLTGDADNLNFVLNTKNLSTDDFPMNFSVVVKSNAYTDDTLPFNYQESLKVQESDEPSVSSELSISPDMPRAETPVTIAWESSDDTLAYDIYLKRNNAEEELVAENLASTKWTSPKGEDGLRPGQYSARVEAKNKNGQSVATITGKFVVIDALATPEIENLNKSYKLDEPIEISWAKVEDPMSEKPFTYDVLLNDFNGESKTLVSGLEETSYKIEGLETGFYTLAIAASNGETSVESSKKPFQVLEAEAPNIPANVTVSADKVREGQTVTVGWSAEEGITYNVYLKSATEPETQKAEKLTEPSYTTPENLVPGEYTARVEAVNGRGLTASEIVNFSVVSSEIEPAVLAAMKPVYKKTEDVAVSWSPVQDGLGETVKYSVMLVKAGEEPVAVASEITETSFAIPALEEGDYAVYVTATNGLKTSESAKQEFKVINAVPETPVVNALAKNVYKQGEQIQFSWSPVTDPMGKNISYNIWVYDGVKPENPNYSGITGTSYILTNLATGTYKAEIAATNGEETSEPAAFDEFMVYTTARASLDASGNQEYPCEYYDSCPDFFVDISEPNFDKETVAAAVVFSGVDSSKVEKTWNENRLHVSFPEGLPLNQPCRISMNSVNDIYGNGIEPFGAFNFKTVPLAGSGTPEIPFELDSLAAVRLTSSDQLPLIGSLTAQVGCFAGMEFGDASILKSDDSVIWNGLTAVSKNNSPVVDIPYDEKWAASTNYEVYMKFAGILGDKVCYFRTTPKAYTTEDGTAITLGTGSSIDPYMVYTPKQMNDVRNHIASANSFRQMRDISLSSYAAGAGWNAIGDSSTKFTGVYDGGNRTISDLAICRNASYTALFGYLDGDNAVICNLTVKDASIMNTSSTWGAYAAVLVGRADGGITIDNCKVYGSVTSSASNAGGLASYIYQTDAAGKPGTVSNCSFNGNVTATSYAGGLIGYTYRTILDNCETTGRINSAANQIGGFIGYQYYGKVKNCHSDMCVSGSSSIGGISGRADYDFEMIDTYFDGTIQAVGGSVGGLVGYTNCGSYDESMRFTRCHAKWDSDNTISGSQIGGLIGCLYTYNFYATDCYAECNLKSNSGYIGGLVGYEAYARVQHLDNCYFKGNIESNGQYIGGLLGDNCNYGDYVMNNCYVVCDHIIGSSNVGGLIGYGGFNINNCLVDVKNIESKGQYAGGLIGYMSNNCRISQSCAKFDTLQAPGGYVGGLVNYVSGGSVHDCCVIGGEIITQNAGSYAYAAGLVGCNYFYDNVYNSYTTAKVTSPGGASGKLIGSSGENRIFSCFTTSNEGVEYLHGEGRNNPSYEEAVRNNKNYLLPEGYSDDVDWGDYPWNPEVWELNTDDGLPRLKNLPTAS